MWRNRGFSLIGIILEALVIGIGMAVVIYACWGMAIVLARAAGVVP